MKQKTELLKDLFGKIWKSSLESYHYSGANLVEEINRQHPKRVLDIGCGENYFKGKIHNLVGLDLVNRGADIVSDFLDYDPGPEYFDIILALGSINFWTRDVIISQLRHAKKLLAPKGKIYMRVNPGLAWPEKREVIIYPWSHDNIRSNGELAGLELFSTINDDPGPHGMRLMFIYTHAEDQAS